MKVIISIFLALSLAQASEVQILDGDAAFELYMKLPGVRCIEWNSADFVVYTKYQTQSCDQGAANDQWSCTIQVNKKNKIKPFESANCSREIP
jgi:hypothetical protein